MPESQALINILKDAQDTVDKNIGFIDETHREVHEGKHFSIVVNSASTASTDALNIWLLGQGATKDDRHLIAYVSANKAGTIKLIEGVLSSGGGGTTKTPLNNNRNSTNASDHKVTFQGTTKSSESGTTLFAGYVGAATGPTIIGGTLGNRQEYILASSKNYTLRYEASAVNTNVIMVAEWYE